MSVIQRARVYLNPRYFSLIYKRFSSAVPQNPVVLEKKHEPVDVKIDDKTIEHLTLPTEKALTGWKKPFGLLVKFIQ